MSTLVNPFIGVNMITIKEYAEAQGIRTQAVYQQIKRKKNKDFIEQHSEIINGITYLDDEAVESLFFFRFIC